MATNFSQPDGSASSTWRPEGPSSDSSSAWEDKLHAAADTVDRLSAGLDRQQLTQALGWFSVGLGLAQLIAPRQLGRAIGVGEHPTLMRLCAVRELASGVGLLSKRAPAAWAWSRAAGDAMDLALLSAAARSDDAQRGRIALTAAAVAGVGALDVYAGQRLRGVDEIETAAVEIRERIIINSTPQELYSFWRNLENLPRFMRHLESVQVTGERTSRWIATAPAARHVEWESEIIDEQPGSHISWRTLPGSQITHDGTVRFEPVQNGRGTVVRVELAYHPPGGRLGAGIGRLFGEEPKPQIHADLRRLKQLIETGEIATTEGQSSGKRSFIGRTLLGRRLQ